MRLHIKFIRLLKIFPKSSVPKSSAHLPKAFLNFPKLFPDFSPSFQSKFGNADSATPPGYSLTEFLFNIYGVSIHLSSAFEVCCTIPGMLCVGTRPHSTPTYFHTLLPRKTYFTLKMLCMHHIIPNRYIYPSDGFYSWLFAPDRGGNRTTKLCLVTYPPPFL